MTRTGLLDGIRVVSIEQAVAAPLCTRHLRDFGADVIKVERVDGGDFARRYDSVVQGEASHFVWLNRGKQSLALNVRSPEGRQVLDRLLARADVLVCNLAPASAERLLQDDALGRSCPRLVRCYISGFGMTGPLRDRKAYDALVQGEAGVTASTGTPDQPAKPGISVADVGAGAYAFGAINAALVSRAASGVGCRIDVSLFDVLTEWMSPLLLAHQHGAPTPEPSGTHHASIVPYGPYATRDGRVVNLAVQNDGQWRRLCSTLLGDDAIADRYPQNTDRVAHRLEVDGIVGRAMRLLGLDEACDLLERADVPWGLLNQVEDVCQHEQVRSRERWERVQLANGAGAEVLRDPVYVDGVHSRSGPVPALGSHTRDVLMELGYSDSDVDMLAAGGHVLVGAPSPGSSPGGGDGFG